MIGETGAGKTTLLQKIAFWLIQENIGLPIWVTLGDLRVDGNDLQPLKDYLFQKWLKQAIGRITPEIEEDFVRQLNEGQVWLLLDGVDEICLQSSTALRAIANQIQGWATQSRVMLTCRWNVWEADINALEAFETYRTCEFSYPFQVEKVIRCWFKKSDPTKGDELQSELAKSERARIQDLVKNPLRLALLCSTWQGKGGELPQTKAGLYERFVEEFYKWNQNRFRTTKNQQRELNAALGQLAWRAIDQESSGFLIRHHLVCEVLGDPEREGSHFWLALKLGWLKQVGIAAESPTDEKVYAFYHRTFQEYFAALVVEDWDFFLPREHSNDSPKPVRENYRILEPRWREMILLWLGREDVLKERKEKFIKKLVYFEDGCHGFYEITLNTLIEDCLSEFSESSLNEVLKIDEFGATRKID